MSSSVIRKITRGVSSGNGDVTISCSITDTDKVIVLLNADLNLYKGSDKAYDSGGAVYLKSVSNSNIIVNAKGLDSGYYSYSTSETNFSYQIIEFM